MCGRVSRRSAGRIIRIAIDGLVYAVRSLCSPFPLSWICFGCLFDMLDSPDAIMYVTAIVNPIIKS